MDVKPEIEFTELQEIEFDKSFDLLSELVDLSEANEMAPRRGKCSFYRLRGSLDVDLSAT